MSVAHKNYRNIPPIPGLGRTPTRWPSSSAWHELKRTDPGLAQAQIAQADAEDVEHHARPDAGSRSRSCRRAMRQAAGAAADAGQRRAGAAPVAAASGRDRPSQKAKPAGRRAGAPRRRARHRRAHAAVTGRDGRE